MSLVVSAVWTDPESGERVEHVEWSDGGYLAGIESAREQLWSAPALIRRGARFLPRLRESDLWVEPEDLDAFEVEVRTLTAEFDTLAAEVNWGPGLLRHYLGNLQRAIEVAREHGGGVLVS
jgi:hypothetical protein